MRAGKMRQFGIPVALDEDSLVNNEPEEEVTGRASAQCRDVNYIRYSESRETPEPLYRLGVCQHFNLQSSLGEGTKGR